MADNLMIITFCCLIYSLLFIPFFIFYFGISAQVLFISLIYFTFHKIYDDMYQTYIFAYENGISIQNKLIAFLKQYKNSLRVKKIESFFLKTQKNWDYNRDVFYYEIYAKYNKNGSDKKLVDVQTQEEALFIEKTLKDYLNIKDNPQEEELGKAD
jgi:hypothetical protein